MNENESNTYKENKKLIYDPSDTKKFVSSNDVEVLFRRWDDSLSKS